MIKRYTFYTSLKQKLSIFCLIIYRCILKIKAHKSSLLISLHGIISFSPNILFIKRDIRQAIYS